MEQQCKNNIMGTLVYKWGTYWALISLTDSMNVSEKFTLPPLIVGVRILDLFV